MKSYYPPKEHLLGADKGAVVAIPIHEKVGWGDRDFGANGVQTINGERG